MDADRSEDLSRLWNLKQSGAISDQEYLRLRADIVTPSTSPTATDESRGEYLKIAAAGVACYALLALIGCVWFSGDDNRASGKHSWNAKDILVGIWAEATGDGRDGSAIPPNKYTGDSTGVDQQADATADRSAWSYDAQTDSVRGKPIYFANLTSDNKVEFGPPYGGGSTLHLIVRKHPAYGQDVAFRISKGQFVCGVEGCDGTINYGRGPERLSLKSSADYDPKVLFASNGSGVIKRLLRAQRVAVELPFFEEGDRQFSFNTAGFVWPPKPPKAQHLSAPEAKGCVKELAEQVGLHC